MFKHFHTLILKARLKPDAKKPPNGPITELKTLIDSECNRNGYMVSVLLILNCKPRANKINTRKPGQYLTELSCNSPQPANIPAV